MFPNPQMMTMMGMGVKLIDRSFAACRSHERLPRRADADERVPVGAGVSQLRHDAQPAGSGPEALGHRVRGHERDRVHSRYIVDTYTR